MDFYCGPNQLTTSFADKFIFNIYLLVKMGLVTYQEWPSAFDPESASTLRDKHESTKSAEAQGGAEWELDPCTLPVRW